MNAVGHVYIAQLWKTRQRLMAWFIPRDGPLSCKRGRVSVQLRLEIKIKHVGGISFQTWSTGMEQPKENTSIPQYRVIISFDWPVTALSISDSSALRWGVWTLLPLVRTVAACGTRVSSQISNTKMIKLVRYALLITACLAPFFTIATVTCRRRT